MKKLSTIFIVMLVIVGCKKESRSPNYNPMAQLTFTLPQHQLMHDTYYRLEHNETSVELLFNEALDENSVPANVHFSDKTGNLDTKVEILTLKNRIVIFFKQELGLKPGWKYELTLNGIRSVSGKTLAPNTVIEWRTLSQPVAELIAGNKKSANASGRYLMACISDIHMGDERATNKHYCWFNQNQEALENFLDFVINDSVVKELVILGDLFDEWMIPYSIDPFDASAGITNTKEYFESVAAAPVNATIVSKLQAIAVNSDVDLLYVPGNHDMLMTEEIMQSIIPGVIWKGDATGLGKYIPVDGIVAEHGHRYDFFNCPQPLVNPGQMLPPGFFMARYYAQGLMDQSNMLKEGDEVEGSFEFRAAWDLALYHVTFQLWMPWPDFSTISVVMGGIDGYNTPITYDSAENMYGASIEDYWPATQVENMVVVPTNCCFAALWAGQSDLHSMAFREYVEHPPAPKVYKIVAFGHTHEPELKVYPSGSDYTSVYANSGSWVNDDQTKYDVRTFLMINPGDWSGSDLDVVTLYQYNKNSGTGPDYLPVRIGEENVPK